MVEVRTAESRDIFQHRLKTSIFRLHLGFLLFPLPSTVFLCN
uniref:Uncharacterized protein n=1 Tax=Anguilla anguilla TaxID=7936 RepID=A0A0E9QJB3_ANGAN